MVRENWFIITLVTHSSGVSNSGVSRGIHHKRRHPLNLTKLYVSGWVESSRSVLLGKSYILVWCSAVNMYISDFWWNDFVSLAYPLFVWLSCVWYFSFAMIINLLMWAEARGSRGQGKRWLRCIAHLGWSWCFILLGFLGLRPMYFVDLWPPCVSFNSMSGFLWHRGVPYVVWSGFKLQDCAVTL